MFEMFPFGRGNMVSFTSFTSFTSTKNGMNGFNITNGYSGYYDPNQIDNYYSDMNNLNGIGLLNQIQNAFNTVLNNVDFEQLAQQ